MTLFARKLRIFWWRIDSDASDYPPIWSAVYEALYRIELALALVGGFATLGPVRAGRLKPDRWAAGLAALFMIGISLLQSAFYVQGRHRFLIEPLLLVFTACGIASLLPRLGAKTHSSNRRALP